MSEPLRFPHPTGAMPGESSSIPCVVISDAVASDIGVFERIFAKYDGSAAQRMRDGSANVLACRMFAGARKMLDWCFQEQAEGRSHPVHVLDADDPWCNLTEIVQRLHAIDPWSEIVLCSSGSTVPELSNGANFHGRIHFVQRPLRPERFLDLVESLVRDWSGRARTAAREEAFHVVVRSLGDGVILLGSDGTILESNTQARHLLGISSDDARTRSSIRDLEGACHATLRDALRDLLDTGRPVRNRVLEYASVGGDRSRWLLVNADAVLLDGEEAPNALVVSLHDATTLRRQLEELSRYDAETAGSPPGAGPDEGHARSSEESRKRFQANMSNEIREPLRAVLGLSDLLSDAPLDDDSKRIANLLRGNGQALLAALNDHLDLARIEAGTMTLGRIPFDMRRLLEDAVETRSILSRGGGAEWTFAIGGEGSSFVLGDPGRMRQILSNLLACAAVSSAGPIRFEAGIEENGAEGVKVRVALSDRGPDLADRLRGSLFRPFQRHARVPCGMDGNGIGLSIVRELISLMGGRIANEHREDSSEAFVVEFDLPGARSAPPKEIHEDEDTRLVGTRILVADRRCTGQEALSRIVTRFGCLTETVSTQESLRAAIRTGGPWHAVLVDRSFVQDDPAGWLRALRSQIDGLPPFLLLTDVGIRGETNEIALAGWSAYLTKPFRTRILRSALIECRTGPGPILTRHSIGESFRKGLRILVADPSKERRDHLRKAIEALGQNCLLVEDGSQALAQLDTNEFDLVVLDNDQDGLEAAKRLRSGGAGRRCCDVPLVALSTPLPPEEESSLFDKGFDDILPLPFSTGTIGALVRKIQDGIDLGAECDLP